MRITFQEQRAVNTESVDSSRRVVSEGKAGSIGKSSEAVHYDRSAAAAVGVDSGKGKTVMQLQQEAVVTDVGIQQDYMILMSNTLSEEDYAKLQEEGFDFGSMNPEDCVTIVDRIKAELARSGKKIVGYTDDVDLETLAAALGSQTLAQTITDSFRETDLPLTEETISALARAWEMTGELKTPEQGSLRYLLDNGLDSEIWNLYMAENSGANVGCTGAPAYYAEEIPGYYIKSGGVASGDGLDGQIEAIIIRAGLQTEEQSRQDAVWLLENGLPLTVENLEKLAEWRELAIPVTEEAFSRATALAVEEGKSPIHARLTGNRESIYEKAVRWEEYYNSEEIWESLEGNITARRQLEEIRLRMTAETNVKLLRSGFSIDTASMEALVDALRQAEQELAVQYFPESADAVEKYHSYHATELVIRDLPGLPAELLGGMVQNRREETLGEVHAEGKVLQETYRKAEQSYEALKTEPRRDLGDDIRKAFANVDDILRDLGQELTEENRRAVRILGYNRMEMKVQNLEKVREADRQVQRVIEKLTPSATLKMIRDGVNPLEKSFAELERYFDTLPEDYDTAAESYSRFLYGLERKNEITAEERESYIGIYRLLRQIEKTDGAAVGALVNAQAELQFSNLLSAVRSGRFRRLDARVDDALGAAMRVIREGGSITEQIGKAFVGNVKEMMTEVSYDEEAVASYNREQLAEYRSALAAADSECLAMLQRGEISAGAGNLLAAVALLGDEEELFGQKSADSRAQRLWERLDNPEEFEERYEETVNEAKEELEEETFRSAQSALDVRHMQLKHKQLTIVGGLSEKQEFFLPVEIDGQLTKVHLRFAHSSAEGGSVEIRICSGAWKGLAAEFAFSDGRLNGILKNSREEVMKTEKIADIFRQEAGESWIVGNVSVVTTDVRAAAGRGMDAGTENRELYRVAKVFLHAVQQGEMTDEN